MIPLENNSLAFGVVEDNNDPAQRGRLRVRIFGVHTEDKSLLPTEDLPWSTIGLPANNASISGLGRSPNGALPGTMVGGLFKDPGFWQEYLVLWSFPGQRMVNKNSSVGFNDPSGTYPRADRSQDTNPLVGGSTSSESTMFIYNRENTQLPEKTVDTDVLKPPVDPELYKDAPWMPFAVGEIGVTEEKNPERVKEYHKTGGGLNAAETVAWCASFVGWCLAQAGVKGTRSAMARSYSNYGTPMSAPYPYGSIAVLVGTRGPSSGHVVFVSKDLGDRIEVIGGNQTMNDGKKYDTGGAVTRTTFAKSKIVAVVYPKAK